MAIRLEDLPPSLRKKVDEKLGKKMNAVAQRKELQEEMQAKGYLKKEKKEFRQEIINKEPISLEMGSEKANRWTEIYKNNYDNACRVYSQEMESEIKGVLEETECMNFFEEGIEGRTYTSLFIDKADGRVKVGRGYTPMCEDSEDIKPFSEFSVDWQERMYNKVKNELNSIEIT